MSVLTIIIAPCTSSFSLSLIFVFRLVVSGVYRIFTGEVY